MKFGIEVEDRGSKLVFAHNWRYLSRRVAFDVPEGLQQYVTCNVGPDSSPVRRNQSTFVVRALHIKTWNRGVKTDLRLLKRFGGNASRCRLGHFRSGDFRRSFPDHECGATSRPSVPRNNFVV